MPSSQFSSPRVAASPNGWTQRVAGTRYGCGGAGRSLTFDVAEGNHGAVDQQPRAEARAFTRSGAIARAMARARLAGPPKNDPGQLVQPAEYGKGTYRRTVRHRQILCRTRIGPLLDARSVTGATISVAGAEGVDARANGRSHATGPARFEAASSGAQLPARLARALPMHGTTSTVTSTRTHRSGLMKACPIVWLKDLPFPSHVRNSHHRVSGVTHFPSEGGSRRVPSTMTRCRRARLKIRRTRFRTGAHKARHGNADRRNPRLKRCTAIQLRDGVDEQVVWSEQSAMAVWVIFPSRCNVHNI